MMKDQAISWQAQWIWNAYEESPRNEWWCFRKEFTVSAAEAEHATLSITADSRYVLYVNGTQLGRGPVRCWPLEQVYDTYEVGHLLKKDQKNTIAVLVMHFGISTYSYLLGRGGLIAQLNVVDSDHHCDAILTTDASWKVSRHFGQHSRVPRMSFQQGFAERIDARNWDEAWVLPEYNDAAWEHATVIGEPGMEPWKKLIPRDIPLMSETDAYPSRVESLHEVRPVDWTTIIDTRTQMAPGSEEHANAYGYAGYIATVVRADESGTAKVGFTYRSPHVHGLILNGERFTREQLMSGPLEVKLHQGDNLFMVELIGQDHGRGLFLGMDSELPFELVSPLTDEAAYSPFVSIGPFYQYEYIDHQFGTDAQAKHRAIAACGARDEKAIDAEAAQDKQEFKIFCSAGESRTAHELMEWKEWIRPVPLQLVSEDAVISLSAWKKVSTEHPVQAQLQQAVMATPLAAVLPVYSGADTELIIDFGKVMSGYISFELDAGEGTIVDLYGFEYMRDGWIQHMHYLENSIRYICREGRQQYLSPIRRGFRYIIVTVRQASRPVRLYDLHMKLNHYPIAEVGQFQCSDAMLNEIWKISQHTTKLCMEDTFVDCPSFEQAFWVGDSRNEALIAYYLFGSEEFIKRCLQLVPGSRYQTPLLVDQVPSGFNSVIPNWTFFWVIACLEYYKRTNDEDFVRTIWPEVQHTLSHYMELLDERGLLFMHAWNFLDWAPIDQPRHGVVTHQNMFLVGALHAAADLAEIAQATEDADVCRQQAKQLKSAVNAVLWSDEMEAYLDCIHGDGRHSDIFSMQTQVVALLCGIAEGDRHRKLASYMVSPPETFVPIGSPFMSFFYYEALAQIGEFDQMVDDIRYQYGRMIQYGATTCWEMYPKVDIDEDHPQQLTRSHCHAWSAAPPYFLGSYVLGVRGEASGWRKVSVQPNPCGLTWARGSVPLPDSGRIDVSWRLTDDHKLKLQISAPPQVEVEAKLPDGYEGEMILKRTGSYDV
ncbi:family 78 glycoside hydrolase catalytic domain [Marinicrinis lubricantis]|uniref:Family 78 glycoside hydrolase catalytic domain n=1 Tax=Marinicrinis lubricantis TaxID=2086470 RepID=A0ABW1IV14_9BACL